MEPNTQPLSLVVSGHLIPVFNVELESIVGFEFSQDPEPFMSIDEERVDSSVAIVLYRLTRSWIMHHGLNFGWFFGFGWNSFSEMLSASSLDPTEQARLTEIRDVIFNTVGTDPFDTTVSYQDEHVGMWEKVLEGWSHLPCPFFSAVYVPRNGDL